MDRLGLAARGSAAVSLLAYAQLAGFWHLVSPWLWVAGVLVATAAAVLSVHRWADLPLARGQRTWARWLLALPPTLAGLMLLVALVAL